MRLIDAVVIIAFVRVRKIIGILKIKEIEEMMLKMDA